MVSQEKNLHSKFEILSEPKPFAMANEWFDLIDEKHFWIKWRYRNFCEFLPTKISAEMKILDIGAGSGIFAGQLERDFGNAVDACDTNRSALELAVNRNGNTYYYDICEKNINLKEAYDVVLMMDVLEHIEDETSFLEAARFHLKPGGLLFLNVPAGSYLFSKYDLVQGHKRRYSKKSLGHVLRKSGFDVLNLRYWGSLMTLPLILRKILVNNQPDELVMKKGFRAHPLVEKLLSFFCYLEYVAPLNPPIGTSVLAYCRKAL